MRFLFQGSRGQVMIRAEMQQNDRSVTGTWAITSAGNDAKGEIRGRVEGLGDQATFRGEITWNSDNATGTGARCVGVATFTGAAVPPTLTWDSSAGWTFTVCNPSPTEVVWSLIRDRG